jgi:hypothetical protein
LFVSVFRRLAFDCYLQLCHGFVLMRWCSRICSFMHIFGCIVVVAAAVVVVHCWCCCCCSLLVLCCCSLLVLLLLFIVGAVVVVHCWCCVVGCWLSSIVVVCLQPTWSWHAQRTRSCAGEERCGICVCVCVCIYIYIFISRTHTPFSLSLSVSLSLSLSLSHTPTHINPPACTVYTSRRSRVWCRWQHHRWCLSMRLYRHHGTNGIYMFFFVCVRACVYVCVSQNEAVQTWCVCVCTC